MAKIRLIGLAGYARTGKSTAAQFLVDKEGFVRVRLADPLKFMIETLLDMQGLDVEEIHDMIHGEKKAEDHSALNGRSPRHAMQTLGTEWGRSCMGEDFWINIAEKRIADHLNDGLDVVVDDIRFQNEVDMIRRLGGHVICMKKSGIGPTNGHESENTDLKGFAGHIWNDGGFDELYLRVVAQLFKIQRLSGAL